MLSNIILYRSNLSSICKNYFFTGMTGMPPSFWMLSVQHHLCNFTFIFIYKLQYFGSIVETVVWLIRQWYEPFPWNRDSLVWIIEPFKLIFYLIDFKLLTSTFLHTFYQSIWLSIYFWRSHNVKALLAEIDFMFTDWESLHYSSIISVKCA